MSTRILAQTMQNWNRLLRTRWIKVCLPALLALTAVMPATAQTPSPYLGSTGYAPKSADAATSSQVVASAVGNQRVYIPVLNQLPPACTRDPNPNFFGAQIYGGLTRRNPYHAWLEASGADWIRTTIPWMHVERNNTTPDNFNWAPIDEILAPAIEGCHHIIGTHADAPAWAASEPGGPINRTSLSELVQYMSALVERYDGDGINDAPGSPIVDYWEMYNEPDISQELPGDGGGWGEYGTQYAQMLAAVYPAIKAANPNAKVLFGGIAYINFLDEGPQGMFVRSFLDDVLAAGGGNYFDYMNFHSYGEMPTWEAPAMLNRLAKMREILAEYGLTKPYVITETGWYSNLNSNQEIQARYTTQLYTHGKVGGIQVLVHFTLADLGGDFPYDTGLVTSADTGNPIAPKLAFAAFKTFQNMLERAQYVSTVPSKSTVEAYEFADVGAGRTIYVAWLNPANGTGQSAVTLPVRSVDLYDLYGNFLRTESDDDGTLTIAVTAQPVYAIEK